MCCDREIIQFSCICITLLTTDVITKQLYRNPDIKLSIKFIPKEQARDDGDEKNQDDMR